MVNSSFVEQIILKSMLEDKRYLVSVSSAFEKQYFDSDAAAEIYDAAASHFKEHKCAPTFDIIVNSVPEKMQDDVKGYIDGLKGLDFDLAGQYPFLINTTDEWLRNKALQYAIMDSANVIQKGDAAQYGRVRDLVEKALTKTIKMNLGLDYFNTIGERLSRIFNAANIRIPTYYPAFDEFIGGGFTPFTLNVALAKIHAGKSLWMINTACRQVMHGHNVVLFTLEMSEDAFAQRADSILTGLDINRIYTTKRKELVEQLKVVKDTPGRGNLFIKQFPTGTASVNEFRAYLHELRIRDIPFQIVYSDYINLMKPTYKSKGSMYEDVKKISEELRALSFEFEVPMNSVSQLNRAGSQIDFSEVDFTYAGESLGLPATCDFLSILGTDQEAQVYQSEIHYKIVKNRLGGRVGDIDKFYMDTRNLRLYDSTELDKWLSDIKISGANGKAAERREAA